MTAMIPDAAATPALAAVTCCLPRLVLTGRLPHTGFAGVCFQRHLRVQYGCALSMPRVENVSLKGI